MGSFMPRESRDFFEDENKEEMSSFDAFEQSKDPFSELSLFLSKKVHDQLDRLPVAKKLSADLSEKIVAELTQDLASRFPKVNFGAQALKASWQKVQYYLKTLSDHKELWSVDGKLQVPAMIREQLKTQGSLTQVPTTEVEQIEEAQKIALSVSECVATVNHTKPNLPFITRCAYTLQAQRLPKKCWAQKSPFEIDLTERFLLRLMVEETAVGAPFTQELLTEQLSHLSFDYARATKIPLSILRPYLCSTLASKLMRDLPLKKELGPQEFARLESFLARQVKDRSDIDRIVPALGGLFLLATSEQKDLVKEQLEATLQSIEGSSLQLLSPYYPLLSREIQGFLHAELASLKASKTTRPVDKLLKKLLKILEEIGSFPRLSDQARASVEIVLWSLLEKQHKKEPLEPFVEKVLLRELSRVVVQHPDASFQSIIQMTLKELKLVGELSLAAFNPCDPFVTSENETLGEKLYRKAYHLTLQGDLLFRSIHLDPNDHYLKLAKRKWKQLKLSEKEISHQAWLDYLTDTAIKENPKLAPFHAKLRERFGMTHKVLWYNQFCENDESVLDREAKWSAAGATLRA